MPEIPTQPIIELTATQRQAEIMIRLAVIETKVGVVSDDLKDVGSQLKEVNGSVQRHQVSITRMETRGAVVWAALGALATGLVTLAIAVIIKFIK